MAVFTYAVRYWITAVCVTPLRSGGVDGDPDAVLRDRDGRAFLQGTSLAGALRGWLDRIDAAGAKALFGYPEHSGHLVLSDGLFEPESMSQIRPRLRIDGASGTADRGGKFDVAHIAAGSKFSFSLTWMATKTDEKELELVEKLLAAVHHGEIRFGAQKTNGFGRVTLAVKKQTYDLTNTAGRAAWMDDREQGTPLELPEAWKETQTVFTLHGHVDSILIKAAAAEHSGTGSWIGNLTENGVPILPGSSIKGAVRERAEGIARLLGLNRGVTDRIFGRAAEGNDNGIQGLVSFEDVRLSGEKQKITRIRIDKFTGGVFRGGLFQEEPMCSNIVLRITVPTGQPVACALLTYALRDLGLGLYSLGSGGAIGRGYVGVEKIVAQTPDQGCGTLCFHGDGACTVDDPDGLFGHWSDALEELRDET